MPSSFTPNRSYELMVTGEDFNTWGDKLNAVISTIDTNMGSQLVLNNPATSVSLTATQSQNIQIIVTGALSGNTLITLGSINGLYMLSNATTSTSILSFSGGVGGPMSVPAGYSVIAVSVLYSLSPLYVPSQYVFTDTGAANAYVINVVSSDFTFLSLTIGKSYRFKAANTNGGASTITINPGGIVKNITTKAAGALGASAIVAGGIYTITYDGTQFQLQ